MHVEKKDGWFIQGLNLPVLWKKKTRNDLYTISKSLIKIKESKLDRMWPAQGGIGEINDGDLIRLKNRYSDSS